MARSSVRVTINHAEAEKLLKSEEVIKFMEDLAEDVLARTPSPTEYLVETWVGVNRARVSIWTDSPATRLSEATDHTLLVALGEGTGGPALQVYTSRSGRTSLRTAAEIANYTRNSGG